MKTVTMPANKATVGEEYTTTKGSTVRVEAQKGDKTVIVVKTPGYGYKGARPIEVTAAYELTGPQGNGGNVKKEVAQAKAETKAQLKRAKLEARADVIVAKAKAKVVARKQVKVEVTPKRKRLPKMMAGQDHFIVISGIRYRKDYRAKLSGLRASECQAANKKSCHCRCGGLFHGKSHKAWFEAETELFAKFNGPVPAASIIALAKKLNGTKVSKNL